MEFRWTQSLSRWPLLDAHAAIFPVSRAGNEHPQFPNVERTVNECDDWAKSGCCNCVCHLGAGYNYGAALLQFSTRPPRVMWQNKNMRTHVSSCVLWNGHIYGFDEDELKCLDFATGKVKWSEKGYGKGTLMLADGKLILYSENGKLGVAQASPDRFKQLASAQVLGGKSTWA